jgi:internalin A
MAVAVQAGPADLVPIPDPALKQAIKDQLGIAHDPNEADMLRLVSLSAGGRNITDLTGLEAATNLRWLDLYPNNVLNIEALSALTALEHLSLQVDHLGTLAAISGLSNLTSLLICDFDITDLSEITGLSKLTQLVVLQCPIQDISAVASFPLLWELQFYSWPWNQGFSDISALSHLTHLSNLDITDAQVTDISPLRNLSTLRDLRLDGNQISDIGVVAQLPNLYGLCLRINQIHDISLLPGLTNLTELDLSFNPISDFSPLSGMTNLRGLQLAADGISDISLLSGMTSLYTLVLHSNQITDISVLGPMTNLQFLDLGNNQISDISALVAMTNLDTLMLEGNHIRDISVVSGMKKLMWLWLDRNPLNQEACDVYIPMVIANYPGINIRYDPCCQSPKVTQQPQSQTVCSGTSVTFTISATGAAPLSYQWRKNGSSIPGATGTSYTINPVGTADAGSYDCVVTNACDIATSDAATLAVNSTAVITSTPVTTATVGQVYSYDVEATGVPAPTYSLITAPSGMTINATTGLIQWTPTAAQLGPNPVTVRAANSCGFGDQTFSVDVKEVHSLVVSSTPGGSVASPGEGTFSYNHGSSVSVSATAVANYHFVNWTGTAVTTGKVASPTSASTTVTMDADYTLQANFAVDTYTLTVNATKGSVAATPSKLAYNHGETVTLEATAHSGYHFTGWSGDLSGSSNPADITMDGNKTVTAGFASDQPGLALTLSSTAGGSVISPGEGTFQYNQGDQVTLEAKADPLFRFVGWSGGVSASANPYPLTVNADYTIRACFESVLDVLYVDNNAPGDPGPGDPNVSDPLENGTPLHPFDMIQEAIDVAKKGTEVIVRSGTYLETIDLLGKRIEINGLNGDLPGIQALPVIDGQGKGTVVRCTQGEDPNCILVGLVITGGRGPLCGGILCSQSSPTITNCLIVGNRAVGVDAGGGIYCQESKATFVNCTVSGNYGGSTGAGLRFKDSSIKLTNSIVWGNITPQVIVSGSSQLAITYSDGAFPGTGNLQADPLFAGAGYWANPSDLAHPVSVPDTTAVWVPGDYHLKSQAGRWDQLVLKWVTDVVTSPCIDAGDPASAVGAEPQPNGNRVNMGAYGGTSQASLSSK